MSEIIFKEDAIEAMLCQTAYRNVEDMEKVIKQYYEGNEWLCGVLDSINAVKSVKPVFCFGDERLEPKKPYTYYSNPPYKTLLARCPNCKRPLRPGRTYRNPDLYCPRCGQAIDWSGVEE